jgi:hypothetical protein
MSSRPPALPIRAGVWAAFLVLAGLMAMHGLGTHGTMATSHEPMSMPSVVHADHTPMLAPAAPALGMEHLAAGCLVVLGLALVLFLGLGLLDPAARRTQWLPAATMRVLRRARAPDPPDLLRLSICRC